MPWGLLNDPFHPGPAGHAALALEVLRALGLEPTGRSPRVRRDLEARVAVGTRDA